MLDGRLRQPTDCAGHTLAVVLLMNELRQHRSQIVGQLRKRLIGKLRLCPSPRHGKPRGVPLSPQRGESQLLKRKHLGALSNESHMVDRLVKQPGQVIHRNQDISEHGFVRQPTILADGGVDVGVVDAPGLHLDEHLAGERYRRRDVGAVAQLVDTQFSHREYSTNCGIVARQGLARHGSAWQGEAWQGSAR